MKKTNEKTSSYLNIAIMMHRQDDPTKCTASKLLKFNLVREIKRTPFDHIILNPFAKKILINSDKEKIKGICAIDCSWKRATDTINPSRSNNNKLNRKLPALLAGNPVNYSKIGMLSTAEALAASLYILDEKETAFELMNKFKWGHTFLDLNSNILVDYLKANDQQEIETIEREYFPFLSKEKNND